MTKLKLIKAAAMFAGALGLVAGTARAAEPTAEQLMQQIQDLQAKVQQLQTNQTAMSSQAVDNTVERVLKDADQRSQMLQMEGFTAGWTRDKGFRIQDAQGNWVLHPFLQFQPRYVANFRQSTPVFSDLDSDPTTPDSKVGYDNDNNDTQAGFEIRRMKIGFDGNAFTPDLSYYFLWATDRSSGNLQLEQAWIRYFFNDDWAFRFGQIRNPVVHEADTSSSMQLAADRSLANRLIMGTDEPFSQAITLMYAPKEGPVTAEAGIEDGFISGNTDFQDDPSSGNCGAFIRVNYFVMGDRAEYKDFTARGNKTDLLVVGAGLDWTAVGDASEYRHTVDVQWENTGGVSVYLAYLGNYIAGRNGVDNSWNWGLLGQVGYMLNNDWEVFGRVGYSKFDNEDAFGEDTWCELTAGVNWYVGHGHDAKVTVDVTALPNGAPGDFTSLGILDSGNSEYMVRGQFQLLL